MRRAALAATGTVAGLAAIFSFKTHSLGVAPISEPSSPDHRARDDPADHAAH